MKIRSGFVSNSSSSSFCIYGFEFNRDKKWAEYILKNREIALENGDISDEDFERTKDYIESGESESIAEIISECTGLNTYYGYDEFYIGRSWDDINDDETGGEFKRKIISKIKEIVGGDLSNVNIDESEFGTIDEVVVDR